MVDALKDIHARQRKLMRTEHAHLAHFLHLFAALPAKRRQLQSELAAGLAAAGNAAQADVGDAQQQLAKVEAEVGRLRDVREGLSEELQAGAQAIAGSQVRNDGDGGPTLLSRHVINCTVQARQTSALRYECEEAPDHFLPLCRSGVELRRLLFDSGTSTPWQACSRLRSRTCMRYAHTRARQPRSGPCWAPFALCSVFPPTGSPQWRSCTARKCLSCRASSSSTLQAFHQRVQRSLRIWWQSRICSLRGRVRCRQLHTALRCGCMRCMSTCAHAACGQQRSVAVGSWRFGRL